MTSVSHADYDRLLLGSPLRRRPVGIVICVALLAALSLATLIHLGLLASMRLDVVAYSVGVLLIFWLLRAEFDNIRCGVSMGRIYRHGVRAEAIGRVDERSDGRRCGQQVMQ